MKGPVCLNRDGTDMAPVQSRLRAGNDEVVKQLAWREPRVTVLDSWALTDASKCPAYEDWVHAPSLAFEQLERWMQDELGCSCSGPPRTDPSPWWNNSRSKFAAAAAAAARKGQTKKKNLSAARPLPSRVGRNGTAPLCCLWVSSCVSCMDGIDGDARCCYKVERAHKSA